MRKSQSTDASTYFDATPAQPTPTPSMAHTDADSPTLLVQQFLPSFTAAYFRAVREVYNTCVLLTRELKMPWLPFVTAMNYAHHYYAQHGCSALNAILLGAAAFFVASKTEGFGHRISLSRVLAALFTVERGSDEFEVRRQQLLTAEMMLIHTLDFDVNKRAPNDRSQELVGDGNSELVTVTRKMLSYSLFAPLCTRLSAEEIAEGTVLFVAEHLGQLPALEARLAERNQRLVVSPEVAHRIGATLLVIIQLRRGRVGVPSIEKAVEDIVRKRPRDH